MLRFDYAEMCPFRYLILYIIYCIIKISIYKEKIKIYKLQDLPFDKNGKKFFTHLIRYALDEMQFLLSLLKTWRKIDCNIKIIAEMGIHLSV
jgi:hypothetical protein